MRTNFTSANAMQFNRQCQPLHFPFKMPKLPIILPCDFRASRTLTYVGSACTFQQFFFKQFGYFFLFFLFFSQMEIDLIVLQQATTEIPAVSERRSRASDWVEARGLSLHCRYSHRHNILTNAEKGYAYHQWHSFIYDWDMLYVFYVYGPCIFWI